MMSFFLLLFPFLSSALVSQLVDPYFPDRNPSSRYLTNNKRLFKAYKSQKMIITLILSKTQSFTLEINNNAMNLTTNKEEMTIDITKYLKDGDSNTFSIVNIQPPEAKITA